MAEPQECLALKQCIARNFYWCIFWRFVLQCIGGSVIAMSHSLTVTVLGWSVYLDGTTILLIGFGFYVKSKGRSPAWCLLALLSLAGWLILILLKDRKSLMLKPGKS